MKSMKKLSKLGKFLLIPAIASIISCSELSRIYNFIFNIKENKPHLGQYLYEKYSTVKPAFFDSLKQDFAERIRPKKEQAINNFLYLDSLAEENIKEKYGSEILSLVYALDREGYDILPYLLDSRFQVYNDIKSMRKSYNKGTRISHAQYKRNIDDFVKRNLDDNLNFMMQNEKDMWEIASKYKSNPFFITTILNIESGFGKYLGKRAAFNTWISIYKLFPKDRYAGLSAYSQIKELLDFSVQSGMDVFDIPGSFMGCIGLCQTLPDNIKRFGADADGDSIINPFSLKDASAFIANYIGKGSPKSIYSYNPLRVYVDKVTALTNATKEKYFASKKIFNDLIIRNYGFIPAEQDKTSI